MKSEKLHVYKVCYDTIKEIENSGDIKADSLGAFATVRNHFANKIAELTEV